MLLILHSLVGLGVRCTSVRMWVSFARITLYLADYIYYQVPRSSAYAADAQLHGSIILDLKEEWKCEEHDSVCFRKDGQHFPLNRWKLKTWAAAIVCYIPIGNGHKTDNEIGCKSNNSSRSTCRSLSG